MEWCREPGMHAERCRKSGMGASQKGSIFWNLVMPPPTYPFHCGNQTW